LVRFAITKFKMKISNDVFLTGLNLPTAKDIKILDTKKQEEKLLSRLGIKINKRTTESMGELKLEQLRNRDLSSKRHHNEEIKNQQEAYEKWDKAMKDRKQNDILAKKASLKKKWEKLMTKVRFESPGDDYYKSAPIQPGFGFFRTLINSKKVPCE
jgi:hypothetical protein